MLLSFHALHALPHSAIAARVRVGRSQTGDLVDLVTFTENEQIHIVLITYNEYWQLLSTTTRRVLGRDVERKRGYSLPALRTERSMLIKLRELMPTFFGSITVVFAVPSSISYVGQHLPCG